VFFFTHINPSPFISNGNFHSDTLDLLKAINSCPIDYGKAPKDPYAKPSFEKLFEINTTSVLA